MVFSISLKVINVDKIVLAKSIMYKKYFIKISLLFLTVLSIFNFSLFFVHIALGCCFIIIPIIWIIIISVYKKLPDDVIIYDMGKKELIVYGYGNIFKFNKPLIINIKEITELAYKGNSPVNKRKTNEYFLIRTEKKPYVLRLLDNFSGTYEKIMNIMPDDFFIEKYIREGDINKILSFEGDIVLYGLFESLYLKVIKEDVKEEVFDIYIFMYFYKALTNGGIHYFSLFFKKYLDKVMDMFKKIGYEECIPLISKLHYLYPNSSGQEFYEDYVYMYSNQENIQNLNNKLIEITTGLAEICKDMNLEKLMKEYIINNNIKF